MTYNVEKIDGNRAKFTITVESDAFNEARERAYKKNRGRINVPGFRKGKVPRKMIERMYGKEVFDDDAINYAAPDAFYEAGEDSGLEIISHPDYDLIGVNDDDTFEFTATVAIKPEVKLGDYSKVTVTKREVKVTDEDVENEINRVREQNSRIVEITERAVQDGDIVNIDFDGYVDDKAFDGGKGEDYDLTIGSHSFIDNFEEQLIGKNIGDEIDVNVTFPENYHEKSLKGKPALFKVKINKISEKQLPELDDEFAEEVSEFDTLEEYRADVRKTITERRETAAKNDREAEAVEHFVELAEMDIPDEAIDAQTEQLAQEFAYRLQMQGMDPKQYMQMTGMTPQNLMAQMRPEAERRMRTRFTLQAVVEAENITAPDSKIDEDIEEMAKMVGKSADDYKKDLSEKEMNDIRMDVCVREAAAFITEKATEVEPDDKASKKENEDSDKKGE
ncbi:MAG: trigger factor [Eubacterium sp.]|nr:trigger factor [Eubacterium sp.]